MNTRFTPFFVATALPFLLFSWFIPKGDSQLDIWILWLVAMLLLGLPMLFLEFALAKRSNQSVLDGMQILTRESDAKVHWRVFSGVSVLLSVLFATGMIGFLSEKLVTVSPVSALHAMPSYALSFGLVIVALILSPMRDKFLAIGAAVIVAGSALSLSNIHLPAMTAMGLKEWSTAVLMA
ncbi:MAG: hypothetical protein Q4C68_08690, partial [Moraxella sp.]|nr:hypothetical protein [Moraxella sp.]